MMKTKSTTEHIAPALSASLQVTHRRGMDQSTMRKARPTGHWCASVARVSDLSSPLVNCVLHVLDARALAPFFLPYSFTGRKRERGIITHTRGESERVSFRTYELGVAEYVS